jgi:farnesyl-diphosphate farnesyltransferase
MEQITQMLDMVSRTFALSIKILPKTLRDSIGLAYLLFRISDCLEDHAEMNVNRKVMLLELWADILKGNNSVEELIRRISDLDSNDPEVYVAQHADDLIQYLKIMPLELQDFMVYRCVQSTIGMARWQRQGPNVETVEELDDYMHQVAGQVGYLLTDIFAWYSSSIYRHKVELLPLAREFGLGLQTVNIIRGLRKDYERGWVFVPHSYLDQVRITREQFFSPNYEKRAFRVVEMLAEKAEEHLYHSLAYIAAFPRHLQRIRLACMWPLFFAVKTLAVCRTNIDVIRDEVKITRQDVKDIIRETILMGWSNRWVYRYYDELNSESI